MNKIPRNCEKHLIALLSGDVANTGAILVEGARQVGKTTLAMAAIKATGRSCIPIDLEDNSLLRGRIDACDRFQDFEELLVDELGFRSGSGGVLFIDEAQESRNLGRFVRYMKERWNGVQVLLTGSSLTRLFRGDTRYPVGRLTRMHLAPFDFGEFLVATGQEELGAVLHGASREISQARHRRLLEQYDQFLTIGGMPGTVLVHASGGDYERRSQELLADLNEDFRRLFGEENLAIVTSCLRSVANFVGSPSKISTVLQDSGRTARRTAEEVFARLEQWAVVLKSEQRGPSPESAHAYHPKRYLFDTGLLRLLREAAVPRISVLDTIDASQRRPLGGILENQVAIGLHHHQGSLEGWKRSSSGSEMDFVSGGSNQRCPIECKAALVVKLTHLKGLRAYLEHYGLSQGTVVSFAPYREYDIDGRIIVNVPAYLLTQHLVKTS